ncbi:hypothetical protein M9H77_23797 [Catharanthus roseus]|uniref:Uncharacterized protein n=1 Tax=Catharanthus roseus TaxID=4058 RepID=A0ACC0AVB1_CATRO|nr:hypothetical protein M9H77_23797 [Catharanthus roseus]
MLSVASYVHLDHSTYTLYGLLQGLGSPAFTSILYSPRDLLESLNFHGPCPGHYPNSVAETHPLVAHEPTEVHGWFLSARASEALSHQFFAIPRSRKAANVTLRASSYLRNSGGRNFRKHSSASSASAGTRSFLRLAVKTSNNSVILIMKFSIIVCVACSGWGVFSLMGLGCLL